MRHNPGNFVASSCYLYPTFVTKCYRVSRVTRLPMLTCHVCRMFVKVHLSYGEGGARSPPQDLLLYDSQCWHCSPAGECNARPNNQCVFSAQASSLQSFRIGKSISRTEGTNIIMTYFLSFYYEILFVV